jgi:hypothetical protein
MADTETSYFFARVRMASKSDSSCSHVHCAPNLRVDLVSNVSSVDCIVETASWRLYRGDCIVETGGYE